MEIMISFWWETWKSKISFLRDRLKRFKDFLLGKTSNWSKQFKWRLREITFSASQSVFWVLRILFQFSLNFQKRFFLLFFHLSKNLFTEEMLILLWWLNLWVLEFSERNYKVFLLQKKVFSAFWRKILNFLSVDLIMSEIVRGKLGSLDHINKHRE